MINSAMLFLLDFLEAVPTLSYDLWLITILFQLVPKMEADDRRTL